MSLYSQRETIDTRTPLQKIRRTTLFRFLTLNGVECSDNDTQEKLKTMVEDSGLGVPIPERVDAAWSERKKDGAKEGEDKMKRPEMIKIASELKIEGFMKMKNPELEKAILDAQEST